jgi:hypothetical protein
MKDLAEIERECCEKAGIEAWDICGYEPPETCTGYKHPGDRCGKYAGEDYGKCPHLKKLYPTGPALAEKLKAWCLENDKPWRIEFLRGEPNYDVWFWSSADAWCDDIADTAGIHAEALTEHEAFIRAWHAAFCGKEKGDE